VRAGVDAPLELDDPRMQVGQFPEGVGSLLRGGSSLRPIDGPDGAMGSRGDLAECGAEAGRIVRNIAAPLDGSGMNWGLGSTDWLGSC
jgi:hypothetical protein